MMNILHHKKAVTLLELIIVMGIFSILTSGATMLIIRSIRSNDVIWEQLVTQSEGRKVLYEIVDEVRKAEESSIGSYPISVASAYELTIYSNIDSDSLRERVRYWLDGTTLKRGIIKPGGNPLSYTQSEQVTEIAHSVKNQEVGVPIFSYFTEAYTGIEDALTQPVNTADVRVIKIQLELEKDPTQTPVPLHVEGLAQVRNLKSN